jgi:hypothetical protein
LIHLLLLLTFSTFCSCFHLPNIAFFLWFVFSSYCYHSHSIVCNFILLLKVSCYHLCSYFIVHTFILLLVLLVCCYYFSSHFEVCTSYSLFFGPLLFTFFYVLMLLAPLLFMCKCKVFLGFKFQIVTSAPNW